jgi:hypothetical protein
MELLLLLVQQVELFIKLLELNICSTYTRNMCVHAVVLNGGYLCVFSLLLQHIVKLKGFVSSALAFVQLCCTTSISEACH